MPPRAISSSNSYCPNAQGSPTLAIVASGGPSSGPPSSMTTKRHFTHNSRGASGGSARPHFGQAAMVGELDINDRFPFQLRSKFDGTFRGLFGPSRPFNHPRRTAGDAVP